MKFEFLINTALANHFSFCYSLKGRTRRGMQDLCDDAYNLYDAVKNCAAGNPFPRFKVKCRVQVKACAWLVDCPGLGVVDVFKGVQARRSYSIRQVNYRCKIFHRQWGFVCCGYYCY